MDKKEYKLNFLGIGEIEDENLTKYDYKIKTSVQAININNKKSLNELIREVESLSKDSSKNEKIAIQFRALIIDENSQPVIINETMKFYKDSQDKLINGIAIDELIEQYQSYVNEHYPNKNCIIEIIKSYYPLDKNDKLENIPELGHIVTYFKDGYSWHVDHTGLKRASDICPPRRSEELSMIKNSEVTTKSELLDSISDMKKRYLEINDNPLYDKKTLH